MSEYRAYILNLDGKISEAIDFVSPDDETAKDHAIRMSGSHDVEIWQVNRRIETLKRVHE